MAQLAKYDSFPGLVGQQNSFTCKHAFLTVGDSRGDRAAMCRPRDDNERGQKTAGGALRLKGSNPFPGAHFTSKCLLRDYPPMQGASGQKEA